VAFDVIVLAGGHGSRAGGPGKPAQRVGDRTLLGWAVDAAVRAGAGQVIVAGPRRPDYGPLAAPPRGLRFVREEPPGAGPVPAVRAALACPSAAAVALLAADLPFLRARHLRALLAAAAGEAGAVLLDDGGHPQWLAGCWQAGTLRQALQGYRGESLRGLLRPLGPALLRYPLAPGEPPPWLDCDTAADLAHARRLHGPD
jgi:molybdopterin-guanine dinucleotide biosynthesis protein A